MLNSAILQGRLVRDPELRYTTSGIPVCTITIAWSEKYKGSETKCFLPVTIWRSTAEMVDKNFTKGREIIVEGRLKTKDWTDQNGNRKSVIEMQANRVHFCGPKPSEGCNVSESELPPAEEQFSEADKNERLPF